MNIQHTLTAYLGLAALVPAAALAQPSISWYTIDGGGGTSSGGVYSVSGTIGQPDAGGPMTGGSFSLYGGFWVVGPGGQPPCYANCDGSTQTPILNVEDFTCFINAFAQALGLPYGQQVTNYANCDGSTQSPVLNVEDFTCFINAFAQGCP